MDEFLDVILLVVCGCHHLVGECFIGEPEWATQTVLDQGFGESAGERFRSPSGNQIPQFEEIAKGWSIVECAGGIKPLDPSAFTHLLAPFASGIKILQAKANRVNLAMAAGTLGFFHVRSQFFPLAEGLPVQTR